MKKVIWVLFSIVVATCAFGTWYWFTFKMVPAIEVSIGDKSAPNSLLIATQGSPYKNDLTESIVTFFSPQDIFIQVVDVSKLDEINTADWSAIFICHTWEMWQPPTAIEQFHQKHPELNNVVYLTTSGDGQYHVEGVDAITSASLLTDVDGDADAVIARLEGILENQQ